MSLSKWQTQRKCELWGIFLRLISLMLGLWGVIFHVDAMLAVSLLIVLGEPFLSPGRWMGALISILASLLIIYMSQYFILIKSFSALANGMVALLLIKTLTHVMEVFGNFHSLLEKMVEAGEFQEDNERLEASIRNLNN